MNVYEPTNPGNAEELRQVARDYVQTHYPPVNGQDTAEATYTLEVIDWLFGRQALPPPPDGQPFPEIVEIVAEAYREMSSHAKKGVRLPISVVEKWFQYRTSPTWFPCLR